MDAARADRRPSSATARPSRSASTSTTSATTGPASRRPPGAARCSRSSRPVSPRPTCGRPRGSCGSARGTSRRRPCLASRVPYGTAVTVDLLGRVERAEAGLRALGFHELRVRHDGDVARIEVPVADLATVAERHDEVVAAVQAAGYKRVTLDLEGLRSGNLNDDLPPD